MGSITGELSARHSAVSYPGKVSGKEGIPMFSFHNITLDKDAIIELCIRYRVREFSIFGSLLREDFNQSSDIDVLVSFYDDVPVSLFDIIDLENELSTMFSRKVDLVEAESLTNPIRRKVILESREVIYAA
jgi:uncharacterized protein